MPDYSEVKDLSVYISNNPETKEILLKKGPHAGEKRGCVSFRGYHLNRVKNSDGKYEPGTTDFYSVTVWDERNYLRIGALLKKGMEVILSGRIQEREYTKRDGSTGKNCDISTNRISLNLADPAIRKIDYQRFSRLDTQKVRGNAFQGHAARVFPEDGVSTEPDFD